MIYFPQRFAAVIITVICLSWCAIASATPRISSLSPASGAPGTIVTIKGANFGSTQGFSAVTFNGIAAKPTSWTSGSIVVPVPAGASSGPVIVNVNGVASNGAQFTVPQGLQITSLSPISGTVGTVVTISGSGFGATQGWSSVTFNGTLATPISWSDSAITVAVPAGATTGLVTVTVGGASASAGPFSIVSGPTISSLSPASAAIGSSITVTGSNFGSTQGFSSVTFNGIAAKPTSWAAGSIVVPVPAGASSGPVIVNVNGVPSNGAQFTVPQGLQITSLSPISGTVGTVVTISGSGFGATQGWSSVTFNGTLATPISWSDSAITVAVPAGATTGLVTVTVGGASASAGPFSIVSGPTISSLSPASAAIGSSITVTGSNFGSTQGFSSVTFNGIAAKPTSWAAGSIVVPVPAGATSGPVIVNVNGVPSNGAQFIVPQGLQITSLSPTSGPIGALVSISGSGFGSTQGWSSVTFNGTRATPSSWSDSAITVPVPTGATTGLLAVTVGGTTASASFTVLPSLSISGLSPALATAGTPVTITGFGFGPTQGSSTVNFNGATATPTSWSSSSIVVPAPSGALTGPVTVTVAGVQSAGAMFIAVSAGGPYAYSLAAGNFDNNSNPDLAIVNRCLSTTNCSSGSVGIMLGNGNGTFKPVVTYPSGGIESLAAMVGDFNHDGIPDLVVLNSCATSPCTSGSVSVLLGNGDGTFQAPLNSSAGGYQSIGIAMGDFNGDHIPDLAIANNCADSRCASGGTVTVLIGKGDGTFKPPVSYASAGQGALSIAVGDFNRDGIPDVAVVNDCATAGCSSGGSVGILLGNGDGTFKPAVTYPSGGQGAYSLASADFNNDGVADLAVVNNCANSTCSNGGTVGVLLGNGDGTFQAPIVSSSGGLFAYSLAVADFNLDWRADLAVTNEYSGTSNGGTVSVLLGNGDGTFQAAANYDSGGTSPFSVVAANFNNFGSTDLAVGNSCLPAFNCTEGVITVLPGNGDGTFGSPASYAALPAGSQSGTLAPPHHQVSLSWNAVVSVDGYNVYRGSQSGGPYTKINPIVDASTSFVDLSVVAGQTYYYVTTAVKSGVESGYSNEVPASIPSP